jgi:hypothetical protein
MAPPPLLLLLLAMCPGGFTLSMNRIWDRTSPRLARRQALSLLIAQPAIATMLRPSPAAAAIDLALDVSGLRWADIRPGTGTLPRQGERVNIDYMMTRNMGVTPMAGAKIYSTKDSKQPFSWTLGDGTVIEGLEIAVLGRGGIPPMRVGGVRRVLIPQPLGYGSNKGIFQGRFDPNKSSLLPVPPEGFEWRDKQGDIVNSYLRFTDLYMNEMRLDEPGLLLDVILQPPTTAATSAATSVATSVGEQGVGGGATPTDPAAPTAAPSEVAPPSSAPPPVETAVD